MRKAKPKTPGVFVPADLEKSLIELEILPPGGVQREEPSRGVRHRIPYWVGPLVIKWVIPTLLLCTASYLLGRYL